MESMGDRLSGGGCFIKRDQGTMGAIGMRCG